MAGLLAEVAPDRCDQLVDLLVGGTGLDGLADARTDVVLEDQHAHRVAGRGDRGELVEDVDAVAPVLIHPQHATQLAAGPAEPARDLLLMACADRRAVLGPGARRDHAHRCAPDVSAPAGGPAGPPRRTRSRS